MVRVSVLNDALKSMYNAEKQGKQQIILVHLNTWMITELVRLWSS
ncbi:unnamed protein product [Musa hybrid cultivar]